MYKNFGSPISDLLIRVRLQHTGAVQAAGKKLRLAWDYQVGGKKFVAESAQDQMIQAIQIPIGFGLSRKFQVVLVPSLKFQIEREQLDERGRDINEDYFTPAGRLLIPIQLGKATRLNFQGGFKYFHFSENERFRYFNEFGSFSVRQYFKEEIAFAVGGRISWQQFSDFDRDDREWMLFGSLQFIKSPFVGLRYSYEDTNSSVSAFSFKKQTISIQTSFDVGKQGGGSDLPLFGFHLIGLLQVTDFPSVFDFDSEGQRFLLTDAEDESFNSLAAKVTYHPDPRYSLECKYTRFSNELSTLESGFLRQMFYLGMRINL